MKESLVLNAMIAYFKEDIRRINHALKVYAFSKAFPLEEEKRLILSLAAILHDIGIQEAQRKHGSTAGHFQELEGPAIAKEILDSLNLDEEIISRVCFLVGNHHSYTKIDDNDFQILVESDFLVNIYEDNIGKNEIIKIKNKYFKTKTGKMFIDTLLNNAN